MGLTSCANPAVNAESGHEALEEFGKKWNDLTEFFNYPKDIRRAIYTEFMTGSLQLSKRLQKEQIFFRNESVLLFCVLHLAISPFYNVAIQCVYADLRLNDF